jgi:hypothetical protein
MEEFIIEELLRALRRQPNLKITILVDSSRCNLYFTYLFIYNLIIIARRLESGRTSQQMLARLKKEVKIKL